MTKLKEGDEFLPGIVVGKWLDGLTGEPLPLDKDGYRIWPEGGKRFKVTGVTPTKITIEPED